MKNVPLQTVNTRASLAVIICSGLFLIAGFFIYNSYFSKEAAIKKENKEALQIAEKASRVCKKESFSWRHCYELQAEAMARIYPLPLSLLVLKKIQLLDTRTLDCHVIVHALIRQYVKDNPGSWDMYASQVDPYACNYGFIHGIAEARSLVDKSFVLNAKTVPLLCKEFSEKMNTQNLEQTCAHIMGHVLLVEKDGSIPKAISICDDTPKPMQRECFAGIFMENFTRNNLVAHGIAEYIPWDDAAVAAQEKICRSYSGEHAFSCWQEISHMYNNRTPEQPEKVYTQCNTAKEETFINGCYIHGANTLAQWKDADKAYLARLCSPYMNDQVMYPSCLNTLLRSLIYADTSLTKRAMLLCEVAPKMHEKTCYSILTNALKKRASTTEQNYWCTQIPNDYQSFCTKNNS